MSNVHVMDHPADPAQNRDYQKRGNRFKGFQNDDR